jgi:hypothetical protein
MSQLGTAMHQATADPPPTAISVDALLAGERRRRRRVRLAVVGALVVLAAGAVPAVAAGWPAVPGSLSPAGPPVLSPAPGPTDADADASGGVPEGRMADPQMYGFTARAEAVVRATLPPGYRITGRPTHYWGAGFSLMWAEVEAPNGDLTQIHVLRHVTDPADGTGGVCARPPLEARFAGQETGCAEHDAGGEALRVATARDTLPAAGVEFEFPIVTRYGTSSALHVWELPYPHPLGASDAERLAQAPALTVVHLTRLAMHPDLAP